MKRSLLATAVLAIGPLIPAAAQNLTPKGATPKPDPVVEALAAPGGAPVKRSEVTVVLDDVGQPLVPDADLKPADAPKPAATEAPKPDAAPASPVLVTGKPPEHAELVDATPDEPHDPERGVAVRVEKIQTGNGPVDPKQVKLLAPFPAKPLSEAPRGWALDANGSAPPFTREVEIAPGAKITLSIRPHLLVPVTDGAGTFGVNEPGFDSALGYQQPGTVGAILATSVSQLDEDSKKLGEAIDRLQQLIISLPSPDPEPPAATPVNPLPTPRKK